MLRRGFVDDERTAQMREDGWLNLSVVPEGKGCDFMPRKDKPIYQNPTYDQHAKRLLSQKTIMARLLKRTVPEFKEAAISDIAEKYIEGTPQISEIPLDRDMTNAARSTLAIPKEILGDSTENLGITEGWIRFDILFHARVPKSGELITLIINVEAQRTQKRSKLGYALLRRAVYYASRLISAQKETEFSGSLYCTQGCGHAERRDGVKSRQDRVQMKTLSETMNPFLWTDSAARNCHCI